MEQRPLNTLGPKLKKLRYDLDLSQEQVAAKCTILGFHISRGTYAKIEAQCRQVTDYELLFLAKVMKVKPQDLLPTKIPSWAKHIESGHFGK